MRAQIIKIFLPFFCLACLVGSANCGEIKSRYATIVYENDAQIRIFNKKIRLGSLSYQLGKRKATTIQDEVKNKLDVIVERAEIILEMFPRRLQFKVVLYSSDDEVQAAYKRIYGKKVSFIAFYAPSEKTMFVSVSDARIGVVAHELGHVVIDHYFKVAPSVKIHEMLAQYVELHLYD